VPESLRVEATTDAHRSTRILTNREWTRNDTNAAGLGCSRGRVPSVGSAKEEGGSFGSEFEPQISQMAQMNSKLA
jgi:hypothetical protein